MPKWDRATKEEQKHIIKSEFSEANEYGHEKNQAAEAQKQMASQETAGLIEQE